MNKLNLLIVLLSVVLISCNSSKQQLSSNNNPMNDKEKVLDVRLNYDTMKIIWADNEDRTVILNENDRIKLSEYLIKTEYDTKWNDSGIMLKMVAPDYTLSLSQPSADDEWLMIWRENNKVKFKGTWYIISEDVSIGVYQLLDKYIE